MVIEKCDWRKMSQVTDVVQMHEPQRLIDFTFGLNGPLHLPNGTDARRTLSPMLRCPSSSLRSYQPPAPGHGEGLILERCRLKFRLLMPVDDGIYCIAEQARG